MSSVYRAVHVETGHEVALKVLPPFMARNPTVLKRFLGEARSAEALEHANIVAIYDHGTDQGRHYLVLEYVKGGDLHEYVQRGGPMSPADAIDVALQVVKGLEHAAARGLIHRDVKPSNLLRTPGGEIKIADLGLALRSEAEDERVTREGTTVGTVDYMAPEQARDSRATSFQSDIYSLGCTLYYLLTALPPYPGGDIADKLARHARNPAPDVRDLRPNVPPSVSALILRMMAKRPEDRFASYAELRSALMEVARNIDGDQSSIALVPIEEDRREPPRPPRIPPIEGPVVSDRPRSSVPEISLATLPPSLFEDAPDPGLLAGESAAAAGAVLPRLGPEGGRASTGVPGRQEPLGRPDSSTSATAWVVFCVVTGLATIVTVIGLDLLLRGPISPPAPAVELAAPEPKVDRAPAVSREPLQAPSKPVEPRSTVAADPTPAGWVEPVDVEPSKLSPTRYTPEVIGRYLPSWGDAPIPDRIDGPVTIVRRATETREPGTVASLRHALDVPKGTVEIADVGPFGIDDFRIAGDARLVRARPGYRPVVRIEPPTLPVVRELPGVVTLDDRRLILDSIDLVLYVRDLPSTQRALFHLAGSQLTLSHCTITIVNPYKDPFTLLRADDPNGRPSRVRLENCLVRGDVSSLFELGRGPVELTIARSILAGDGSIIRTPDVASPAEHRVHLLGDVLACRGPCLDLGGEGRSDPPPKRLAVRAFDNAFGRFEGPGTASLAASQNPAAALGERIDWLGDNNLFLGWRAFFANGPEHTIRTRNLPAFRSTWSAVERNGREIYVAEWPAPAAVADLTAADLAPLLSGREASLEQAAKPRPYLLARTLLSFPAPAIPALKESSSAAVAAPVAAGRQGIQARQVAQDGQRVTQEGKVVAAPGAAPSLDAAPELEFDADSAGWEGDLGAFLREKLGAATGRVRVRVRGSGSRRCSPVRLPDGLILEMRVERPAGAVADGLILVPAAQASGSALIELHGGSLSLSQFRIQSQDDCLLESLIRVEDGVLALRRCELTGGQGKGVGPARLIDFRAATTQPRPVSSELFTTAWDRPACVLSECVLITDGAGLRAEVGLGFVGLSGCVVAAKGDVVGLEPAAVARGRFNADLRFDRCTIAAGSAVVRVGTWSGAAPAPDRPWVVTSSHTAYLDLLTRESAMLRGDAEAIAQGVVFFQQSNDAVELAAFAEAGDAPPPSRTRDVVPQWVNLWGSNHIQGVTGPRLGASSSVRFLERPKPGRIEPADLILDANHHPGRPALEVGAPPSVLAAWPRTPASRKR